jgi:hypothetical protein
MLSQEGGECTCLPFPRQRARKLCDGARRVPGCFGWLQTEWMPAFAGMVTYCVSIKTGWNENGGWIGEGRGKKRVERRQMS